jgi:hypothetical protein
MYIYIYICSPMVVGQTYTEHQVYLELNQVFIRIYIYVYICT